MKSKKELILDAALQQFAEEGYSRATMQSIAKRAGVGKGTTYEYFSSKEALFSEVLSSNLTYILDVFITELATSGSVYEKVKRMYMKQVELYRSEVELRRIMQNDLGNIPRPFHDQFRMMHQRLVDAMDQVLIKAMDEDEIKHSNLKIARLLLLNGLQVIVIHLSNEEEMLECEVEQLLDLMFDGLLYRV